jgi:hypothetical protein
MGKAIDWEGIEREYRAGQLSVREIGRQFGISETAIRKKAGKSRWERDLSARVREKVRTELVRREVRKDASNDREIVSEAAARVVSLVLDHRKDIAKLRELEQKFLDELNAQPTKLYLTQFQGIIVEKEVGLTITEKSTALHNLATVQARRIQLERQAFNLEDRHDPNPGAGVKTKEERDAIVAAYSIADD